MKSDVIHVKSSGEGIAQALSQAESVAAYKSLSPKNALHLRLLTEEMMGLLRAITGNLAANFWIEDHDNEYRLYLVTTARMNLELRQQLLSAATSGRNAAAKGVIGKLRDLFERAVEPVDDIMPDYCNLGLVGTGIEDADIAVASAFSMWSLNQYRQALESKPEQKEQWDELEKSVIAKIADEIRIGINGSQVEMIVFKRFQ